MASLVHFLQVSLYSKDFAFTPEKMTNVMGEGVRFEIVVDATLDDVIDINGMGVPSMSDDICWRFCHSRRHFIFLVFPGTARGTL